MRKKINKTPNEPLKNGTEITRHSNGSVRYKIPYVNGKRHGVQTLWYDDGRKWSQSWWNKGNNHGMYTYWSPLGVKQIEAYYLHGQQPARIQWSARGYVVLQDPPSPYQPTDTIFIPKTKNEKK